jgi:tRNA threonylcarbamoyladenosine biosynthesis protein TsaE
MSHKQIITRSEAETHALGYEIGKTLQPGTVLTLTGSLGSGKTVFTKGVAAALGIQDTIISPTYTLIQEYDGDIKLYHMDLYRIASIEDFEMLGAEELLYADGISVIEWSEVITSILPEGVITVVIKILENQDRLITIEGAVL